MKEDIVMFLMVLGVILADILTGLMKAYFVDGKPSSRKMRYGGMHKLSELIIICVAIGLKEGFALLGEQLKDPQLALIAGAFTLTGVFGYILLMELISILENFSEINPDAAWVKKYLKKFRDREDDEK